ncbi:MAG: T9SS type A sorting domain-containing protein [Flavobacteriales bacterium]|nr:T9SS type A sorting domain-containing protein [Flavobacteriales bacterium]
MAGQSGTGVEWVIAEHILDGVAGNSDVRVRFLFFSDASVNFEGFALDDISIRTQAQLDLVALSYNAPTDGCSLNQEEVSFTFWNKGLQTVSNFEVGFIADNGAVQTETYTGSVAQGDTVTHTFTTELADLVALGPHTIDVFTALVGDEYLDTDTLWGNMVSNFDNTALSQTEEPELPISATILEGTTSNIFFCGLPEFLDGCLQIDNVTIDSIQHTFLSDLDIYLVSPAGDTVELSTDNGGAGDDMVNVVFSDTSTNDITLQVADILPGIYHTEDTSGFAGLYNGQNPNGAWSLWIMDDLGGDDGVLVSWSMTFIDNSPEPFLAQTDTSICLTQVLTVSSAIQYDSYLWSTGANMQEVDLFGNVLGLGEHEISVTVDEDGCSGISNSFVLTVDACAGISELGNLTIDVYPNPSNGEIILDVNGESDRLDLTVIDVNGKQVFSETIGKIASSIKKPINLNHLAKGIYLLKLANGKTSVTRKLIIQ